MRHYDAMSVILSAVFAAVMTAGLSAANGPILRLMNYSEELLPDDTRTMDSGCVIGAHTGPGCLAMAWIPRE